MVRKFHGSSVDGLVMLRYLYRDHPKQCTFVLTNALREPLNLGIWRQVAFVWENNRLSVPGGSMTSMEMEIGRCRHSLTVIPLLIVAPRQRHLHINILVVDRDEATVELFEPFGILPSVYGPQAPLEAALGTVLMRSVRSKVPPKILKPNLSTGSGLQALQELEGIMRQGSGLPPGYCMAWAALYAKVRLASPLEQRAMIPDKILSMARDQVTATSLTEFIQSFASELMSERSERSERSGESSDTGSRSTPGF
jgi:hypothetical protein